jgi:hypothetical protein
MRTSSLVFDCHRAVGSVEHYDRYSLLRGNACEAESLRDHRTPFRSIRALIIDTSARRMTPTRRRNCARPLRCRSAKYRGVFLRRSRHHRQCQPTSGYDQAHRSSSAPTRPLDQRSLAATAELQPALRGSCLASGDSLASRIAGRPPAAVRSTVTSIRKSPRLVVAAELVHLSDVQVHDAVERAVVAFDTKRLTIRRKSSHTIRAAAGRAHTTKRVACGLTGSYIRVCAGSGAGCSGVSAGGQ